MISGFFFHDIAACSGAEGALAVERFVVHGEYEALRGRVHRADVFDEFKAVLVWQRQINDGEVGLEPTDDLQPFTGAASLAANIQTDFGTDELRQPVAHDGVVVDEDDALH
jgi:hypothetical protein